MTPKPDVDTTGAPSITLAGRGWVVPPLAMRENRKVLPRVMRLFPLLDGIKSDDLAVRDAAAFKLSSEEVIEEIIVVLHAALTRAYEITMDEFLDMPITPGEWTRAILTVIQQTEFFQSTAGGGRPAGKGEPETTES